MKITVLGCGALGQLWIATLSKCGYEVQGWLKIPKPYCKVNLIDENGIVFNKCFIANDYNFLAHSNILLVTLKAWQVSNAVKSLANVLPNTSPIILLHNGMGTLDELKNIEQPIIIGIMTHAAKRSGNVVIHVSSGTTHIGPAKKLKYDYSYLADILHYVLPDVAWHNTIKTQLWRKLAVNCVINPLTAIWECPNGVLRNFPNEISDLCKELALVIEREGLHSSEEDLRKYIEQIIIDTSENTSSMLSDILAFRHTEIDYITGYLLKRARIHGVSVPKNAKLYELVKIKESKYECNNSYIS